MKRLWISIGLFVSVLLLCIYELFAIRDISEKSEYHIMVMQERIEKNDINGAIEVSRELNELWDKNYTILTIFIHHDPLEEIEQTLRIINTSIVQQDIDSFWTESTRAYIQITKLSDTDIPSIGNIL